MKILPRSDWTSTPDNRHESLDPDRVVGIAVHYPAAGNVTFRNLTKAQVASRLEGWRAYHVNSNGWRDIGYNYAIDQSGRVWHLTGLDVGAHANAIGNPTRVGVLFVIGNNEQPTEAALSSFREFRQWVLTKLPKATRVEGHQQVPGNSTACPGRPLMAAIRAGHLTATTPRKDWFDMADKDDLRNVVREELAALPADVWRYLNPEVTDKQAYSHLLAQSRSNAALKAELAGLTGALRALTTSSGYDPERIEQAIKDAVDRALSDISITLTTEES